MTGKTTYTKTMAKAICDAVSDGSNLEQIGKKDDFPCRIIRWIISFAPILPENTVIQRCRGHVVQLNTITDIIGDGTIHQR